MTSQPKWLFSRWNLRPFGRNDLSADDFSADDFSADDFSAAAIYDLSAETTFQPLQPRRLFSRCNNFRQNDSPAAAGKIPVWTTPQQHCGAKNIEYRIFRILQKKTKNKFGLHINHVAGLCLKMNPKASCHVMQKMVNKYATCESCKDCVAWTVLWNVINVHAVEKMKYDSVWQYDYDCVSYYYHYDLLDYLVIISQLLVIRY